MAPPWGQRRHRQRQGRAPPEVPACEAHHQRDVRGDEDEQRGRETPGHILGPTLDASGRDVAFACAVRPGDTGLVRTTSALLGALTAGLLVSLGASVPLALGDAKPATMPVSEVKDGMKGYGLTVFKGTEPRRFDVEVIGVLHNFRAGQPLIVIKTPDPRLDIVKTVRGISGSPISLEGRLAGAYSYSLSAFELEPVAGVTPIDLMLTEMRRPIPPGFWPLDRSSPLPSGKSAAPSPHAPHASIERFDGPPGSYDFAEHARQLADK